MSNDVEYSPDFEASENDTSQLVSGQSEILDEVESSTFTASKSEAAAKQTPPFTAESAEKVAPETKKDEEKSEETSPSVRNKELEEIEDIIRKLERLEKAQTMLEDALHLSDAEQDLGDISERSERSLPSRSVASSFRSSSRKGGGSRVSNQESPLSDAAGSKHEDLSEVINNGLASIQEIIEKEKDLMQPLKVDRPPSPPALLSTASDKSSRKSISLSRSSKMQKKSKVVPLASFIDESGDHDGKRPKPAASVESPDALLKLKSEIARDEGLILAYQKENEKLYGQLKAAQEEIQAKDAHHVEEVNGLKTEIATLKLNRLVSSGTSSPRLGSAHKGELDRLNEELTAKSLMIVELRKEIALLKVEKESRPISAKRMKSPVLCIDKEKEYQDKIRAMQKQVRTLQRILYSKESKPAASPAPARANLASKGRALSLGKFEVNRRANSANSVDQDVVKRLEDTMRKERAELQHKIHEKQCVIEEKELQLNALKLELTKLQNEPSRRVSEDAEAESAILEQLQNRLLNQSEIIQSLKDQLKSLKDVEQERNALKREVVILDSKTKDLEKKVKRAENMARPSFRAGSAPAKPSDIGKPAMGPEKEKDYQKQIQNLQKQVRTLQKILYSKDPSAAAANPVTTNAPNRLSMSAGNKEEMFGMKQGQTGKPEALKKCTTTPSFNSNYNAQVLQATFDQERQEMEHLLEHRQKQIDDRDRQIRELKSKLCATIEENAWVASESATEKANYEEFRAKLATQSKIIDSLQQRLASYGNIEAEKCLLKKEIGQLEFRIQDLQRRLSRAENLARPENEVLATLSEKVEDLHTRYYYRERQLDTLLDRLSVKTGAIISPRSLSSSYRCRNGNLSGSSGLAHGEDFNLASLSRAHNNHSHSLDLGDLSPSAALHMIPHRDVPEI